MQPFSTKGAIQESWTLFKKHWALLWGAMIIMVVVSMVMGTLGEKQTGSLAFLIAVVSMLVSSYLRLGFIRLTLNVVTEKQAHVTQLFGEHQHILRFLGASIVYGIIVGVGFLLFIIPGIIWSIKYGYYGYLILDKDLGMLDSLKKSGEITQGAKWQLLGVGLLMALLIAVSAIPLGLGLIATVPMAAVLTPLLYARLQNRYEGGGAGAGESSELLRSQAEVPKPPTSPSGENTQQTQSV